MHSRTSFGLWGEAYTCSYLESKGYTVIDRNYHSRFGEIDVIATYGTEICFVEVKSRKSLLYGTPAEAVTKDKQAKIHKTAFCYLREHPQRYRSLSFDVVEIYLQEGKPYLNHLQHCF